MDFNDLLDLCFDETTIDLFDIDTGEVIESDLSIDEAREWFEEHDATLCSINIERANNIVCNIERAE